MRKLPLAEEKNVGLHLLIGRRKIKKIVPTHGKVGRYVKNYLTEVFNRVKKIIFCR